jgi:hypothetical protein
MIVKRIEIELIGFIRVSGKIKNTQAKGCKHFDGKPTGFFTKNQKRDPIFIGQHGVDMVHDAARGP